MGSAVSSSSTRIPGFSSSKKRIYSSSTPSSTMRTAAAPVGRAVASLQKHRQVVQCRRTAATSAPTAQGSQTWRPRPFQGLRSWANLADFRMESSGRATTKRSAVGKGATIVAGWGDPVDFIKVKITKSKRAFDDCQYITIDASDLAAEYKIPGQFVQMKVIEDGKPGFFAMASAPGVSEMEFLIKRTEGAAGDLMDAKEGSEVFMSAPMGKGFGIESAPAEDYPTLLLFAAGTGISPLRALLESGAASGRSDVRLYYGVKDEDTMAYIDKFGEWADAGVDVVQCFSDPKGVDALNKGYVQDIFQDGDGVADPAKTAVVICGMKGMSEAVIAMMEEIGVPKDKMLMNF